MPVHSCRFGDRCALDTYESALDCLGSHSELTKTEIAARVVQQHPERSAAYIRNCLNPNDQAHTIQLLFAPAFTKASGNPALLAWHARECGYGIHKLPGTSSHRSELLASLMDVVGSVGDLARAVNVAKADRRITAAERQDMTMRGQQAIAELVELIAAVNLEAEPEMAR